VRIVIDEGIPRELAPLFSGAGMDVRHVEDIGLQGMKNGALLTALSASCDVFVTGDTSLEHQQNLAKYDLAIVVIRPQRLVVDQIKPLIPLAVAAFTTAPKHAVTTIGVAELSASESTSASSVDIGIIEGVGASPGVLVTPVALSSALEVDVPQFLIVYNQQAGAVHLDEYPDERRDDALARRFDLEREHRLEPHIEVVLLSARSQDVLRRTHARYFKTVQELVQSA
jgi:predicted nuclease of predicted toxin-antitoxin system